MSCCRPIGQIWWCGQHDRTVGRLSVRCLFRQHYHPLQHLRNDVSHEATPTWFLCSTADLHLFNRARLDAGDPKTQGHYIAQSLPNTVVNSLLVCSFSFSFPHLDIHLVDLWTNVRPLRYRTAGRWDPWLSFAVVKCLSRVVNLYLSVRSHLYHSYSNWIESFPDDQLSSVLVLLFGGLICNTDGECVLAHR